MKTRSNISRISYHYINEIVGRIVDRAEFLEKVDPIISHFVLFHEDIRINNILLSFDDPSQVVAIVDWEGARILPMWSCFYDSQVAEVSPAVTEQQCKSMRDLRRDIMFKMEPGLANIHNEVGSALRRIYYLVIWRLSTTDSVQSVNEYILNTVGLIKPCGEDAFAELMEFAVLQNKLYPPPSA
jgi:Phosphotransferase enzyme family